MEKLLGSFDDLQYPSSLAKVLDASLEAVVVEAGTSLVAEVAVVLFEKEPLPRGICYRCVAVCWLHTNRYAYQNLSYSQTLEQPLQNTQMILNVFSD